MKLQPQNNGQKYLEVFDIENLVAHISVPLDIVFEIKNVHNETVKVNVTPGCGCTTSGEPMLTISPNEVKTNVVSYTNDGRSSSDSFRKVVDFYIYKEGTNHLLGVERVSFSGKVVRQP